MMYPPPHPAQVIIQHNTNMAYPSPPQPMYVHPPPAPKETPPPPPVQHPMASPSSETSVKKPNLRVQIPNESPELNNDTKQQNEDTQANTTSSRPVGPPSALPSQFAQNLPSPSTFYPEFYQQNELPSPLNFSATPTTSSAFNWPPRDYRPSPLSVAK